MPARVSRSTRSSAVVSHKSSVQTLKSRASTASRISAPYAQIPEESPETTLRIQICTLFKDAQRSTASHRKLVINLRKIQEACCYEPTGRNKKTGAEEFDEEQFIQEVTRCVLRIMPVKRSETVGERVVRFLGLFLRHTNEKDNELATGDNDETGVMIETPSSRLTAHVMSSVLPLLTSKDKVVRYRSTQLVSHIVNSLDSIDDDLFRMLRNGLLRRIRDKEAMVRVQAVLGLGRLTGNDADGGSNSEDSEDDDVGSGLLDKLLDVLQNDPSADVRRSLLVNLPILPNTLPFLLERARDQDPATRRALYSRLLPALGDFRHLSLSMREKLLRWGLRDRDENVRKAAGRLFRERWIEDCALTSSGAEGGPIGGELAPPNFEGLLELLERIDIVNSGVENGVALEAMKGFWECRPDYRDAVSFDDLFWDTLTAESVFMARSFNDFCRSEGNGKFEDLVEQKMPEVTKLSYYLQRYINVLVEALKSVALQDLEGELNEEEDTVEQEFIVEQLLHIAQTLDYSDEVGRRRMFALLRQSLSVPDLPEEVTKLIIEVLRGICAGDAAGEREFCSVVLESVADIHDTIMDDQFAEDADESFHSAKSEVTEDGETAKPAKNSGSASSQDEDRDKAIKEIMVNMKCLHIVQCMLQNIEGNLQQNADLVGMLNNLVVPAVRSHEAPVRERGLICLGLCSLLDKSLAEENLTLFMHFFSKGHAALQITALQILTDILTQHGAHLLETNPALLKIYLKALKSGSKTPEVQAAATVAVCKLTLGRVIQDSEASNDLLKTLIVAYFDPATQCNQGVRQTLSYFLPVYSYSRRENQDRIRSVAMDAMHQLFNIHEGRDDEDEDSEMVSLSTIGAHLVDWTDPRKCYAAGDSMSLGDESTKKVVNGDVHLDLARDILEKLNSSTTKEEKKILAPLLSKIYVSPASGEDKLRELYTEVSAAIDEKLLSDATGRNALYKIHVSLGKIVNGLGGSEKEKRSKNSTPVETPIDTPTTEKTLLIEVEDEDEKTEMETVSGREEWESKHRNVEKEEEEEEQGEDEEDDGTVIGDGETIMTKRRDQDSLVSELLSDEESDEF